MVRMVRT